MVVHLEGNSFIDILSNFPDDKIILVEGKNRISAGELLSASISLAIELKKNDVKKNDKVVIAIKPGVEFLKLIYANMLIRTVISIIDPEMGHENYASKFRQFQPEHVFVDSRLILLNEHPILKWFVAKLNPSLPVFPKTKNCKVFTVGKKLPILKSHKHLQFRRYNNENYCIKNNLYELDDFLVTYTSGTLSEPKGVVHSYKSLSSTMSLLTDLLKKNEDERIITHLPHFMLLGINAGCIVYLWDNESIAKKKLELIEQNEITTIFGPPSDFVPLNNYLELNKSEFPNCVRNFYFGSAPVYSGFLKSIMRFSNNAELTCLYGMTENLMICLQDGKIKVQDQGKGDLVGRPFSEVKIQIQKDGEIGISSSQQFERYWHNSSSDTIHLSGDLGRIDENGNLYLIGRKKDMIIRRNFNIYPGLYESTINKISGIDQAVLLGIYDDELHDEVVYLVIESALSLSEKKMMEFLTEGVFSIDKEALPDKILFRPLVRFGRQNKVDRNKMREQIQKEH